MKQSNGHLQEPMATPPELDHGQQPQEDHHEATNNIAAVHQPDGGTATHEFSLAIKPKGTPLFKLSALYKGRLKFCLFLHILLFLVMMAKLSEDILDRMDIFVLQLQELFIPKPRVWEWCWSGGSVLAVLMGMSALSRNRPQSLTSYAAATLVLGVLPLFYPVVYFFNDVCEYAEKKNDANVEKWQGFPVALYWYIFVMVALQVHLFSIFFAAKLIKIWRMKMKRY